MDFRAKKYSEVELREYISNNYLSSDEWDTISFNQTLSEDFIREFTTSLDWWYISFSQKLSEDFIREFSELVVWVVISHKQVLSRSFKYLMHNKVHIKTIVPSNNTKEVL